MPNNNLLFNAALNGYLAGSLAGRSGTDPTVATIVTAAAAFATRVDSKIALDGTISGGGGVSLPPTTAAITDAQASKTQCMQAICAGLMGGRYNTDAVAADYDAIAITIAAQYTAALAGLVTG